MTAGLVVDASIARGPFTLRAAFAVDAPIVVLRGPSGSGKTTLLDAISGLLAPTSGRIAFRGATWDDASTRMSTPPEARGIGRVFQRLALFPHMTALENVAYPLPASPDRRAIARRLLARFRIDHAGDERPSALSGGEAQRVALARAAARSPALYLLDEPFSALDPALADEISAAIAAVAREERATIVAALHGAAPDAFGAARGLVVDAGVVREADVRLDRDGARVDRATTRG